jgi:hypothetical protein
VEIADKANRLILVFFGQLQSLGDNNWPKLVGRFIHSINRSRTMDDIFIGQIMPSGNDGLAWLNRS